MGFYRQFDQASHFSGDQVERPSTSKGERLTKEGSVA
jgi:hypothetical protein